MKSDSTQIASLRLVQTVHQLYQPGAAAVSAVQKLFPDAVVNGGMVVLIAAA